MALPKVYEIALKTESEAHDFQKALEDVRRRVALPDTPGISIYFGVIRDDDKFNGNKDIISRHTEHVTVLAPRERQRLEKIIDNLAASNSLVSEEEKKSLHAEGLTILGWQAG